MGSALLEGKEVALLEHDGDGNMVPRRPPLLPPAGQWLAYDVTALLR
jgi:hypothetical protein